jgi:hypothetical protein
MALDAMSNFLETELLDHVLNNDAYTSPTIVYIALYTAAPSDAGGGTEVSGGAYGRVALDSSTTNKWTNAGGTADNISAITFTQATASWGTVTHMGIFDASTAGNLLLWGTLTTSRTVNNGDTFEFAAGDLDVTFD